MTEFTDISRRKHINPTEFIEHWREFEHIGAPDPVLFAAATCMGIDVNTLHMQPKARKQLEDLVAYWKYFAKPGHVLAAMKAWNARVEQTQQEAERQFMMDYQYGPMQ